ncbi:MAG: hypothetical protein ACXWVT_07630 [Burkholderiaceae bacterium]
MKKHWLDHPGNVRLLWRLFLALLVLSVLAELVVSLHPSFAIESLFGFYSWFGFLACVAMIGVAKGLSLLLKRSDKYYEEGHD